MSRKDILEENPSKVGFKELGKFPQKVKVGDLPRLGEALGRLKQEIGEDYKPLPGNLLHLYFIFRDMGYSHRELTE